MLTSEEGKSADVDRETPTLSAVIPRIEDAEKKRSTSPTESAKKRRKSIRRNASIANPKKTNGAVNTQRTKSSAKKMEKEKKISVMRSISASPSKIMAKPMLLMLTMNTKKRANMPAKMMTMRQLESARKRAVTATTNRASAERSTVEAMTVNLASDTKRRETRNTKGKRRRSISGAKMIALRPAITR